MALSSGSPRHDVSRQVNASPIQTEIGIHTDDQELFRARSCCRYWVNGLAPGGNATMKHLTAAVQPKVFPFSEAFLAQLEINT